MADKLEFSEKLVMTTLSSINFINQVQMPLYRWCSLHEAKKQSLQKF